MESSTGISRAGLCRYLLGRVVPKAWTGLWSGIRLYEQRRFQLEVPLAKGWSQLGNRRNPLTPWVEVDGCVSLFILETGRSNGSSLLGDCFFSPQGCDVVLGCLPCLYRGGAQTWTTVGARELVGTLSRSTLEEVGAERSVGRCTLPLPQGWEQRPRASWRDRSSVRSTCSACAETETDTSRVCGQHWPFSFRSSLSSCVSGTDCLFFPGIVVWTRGAKTVMFFFFSKPIGGLFCDEQRHPLNNL